LGGPGSGLKEGTVGRPIPNVMAKVTDLDTGQDLKPNQAGMLWIKGPNVMKGYLNQEQMTAEVIRDGWYMTGDVAVIDEDGYISITGRQSRFSKIGGEMVPHIRIEEILNTLLADEEGDLLKAVVTAVPDVKKGERLVVLHTSIDKTPGELRKALAESGLPNIYLPSEDSFREIEAIPVLGTGKLDLRGLKKAALDIFGLPAE
jgi:acyl-[acyl-carrier-protein]-phospholipid O-acyltransferase/long-chain-fatty-acid--[acyl-carrier-protein] ligase